MEIPEIFEELSKSTKSKSIKSLTKKLSKKFNTDNPEILENICKLAYILYIYRDNNSAKTVIDLIKPNLLRGVLINGLG